MPRGGRPHAEGSAPANPQLATSAARRARRGRSLRPRGSASATEAARRNEAAGSAQTSGVTTPRSTVAPAAPTEGLDTTRPTHDVAKDDARGNLTGTTPSAQDPGVADHTKDATNTKINDRDRHGALTPGNQGGGNDRDITAAIRRALVSDGSLSFNAKNVKIMTVGGKVTLRGAVKSDAERSTIESKAKAAPGVSEVDSQLEVKK